MRASAKRTCVNQLPVHDNSMLTEAAPGVKGGSHPYTSQRAQRCVPRRVHATRCMRSGTIQNISPCRQGTSDEEMTIMRTNLRRLARLTLLAGVVAAVGAVARAAVARLSGEPGHPAPSAGSYDSWPPVPPAPPRDRS